MRCAICGDLEDGERCMHFAGLEPYRLEHEIPQITRCAEHPSHHVVDEFEHNLEVQQ